MNSYLWIGRPPAIGGKRWWRVKIPFIQIPAGHLGRSVWPHTGTGLMTDE